MTAAESALWALIRQNKLAGYKFRRQHVIKGYILDFYSSPLKLGIEVDGLVHRMKKDYDQERTAALAELGVFVLRLSNAEILGKKSSIVLDKILQVATKLRGAAPPPFTEEVGRGT